MVLSARLFPISFHRGCCSLGEAVISWRLAPAASLSFCTLSPLHHHQHRRQQQQQQHSRHATRTSTAGLRRPRNYQGPHDVAGNMPDSHNYKSVVGKLQDPQSPNFDQASLSPWVPLPDVVARRALELANAGPHTIHVDLGSGDGRVCFHALQAGVASSIGIDVDANMIETALARMAKRHPQPDNLQFLQADLLRPDYKYDKSNSSDDSSSSSSNNNNNKHQQAWQYVQQANLITMYFATPGLTQLRPLLERQLVGRTCTIITAGYEMPGWEAAVTEVVLGTQIHVYHWGGSSSSVNDAPDDDGDDGFFFPGEDILMQKQEGGSNPLESDKFQGATVIDRTGRFRIRGFSPDIFNEEEDDDAPFFSDSDDEEDGKDKTGDKK